MKATFLKKLQITNTLELISIKILIGKAAGRKEPLDVGRHFMLFKLDAGRQSYETRKRSKLFFGLLVLSVVLYGCEIWANSTSISQWKQIERIQKRLITSKFKIKSRVLHDVMLSKMRVTPIEAIVMAHLISYLKRSEQMGEGRWPKVVVNDILCKRKKTWMQQNIK